MPKSNVQTIEAIKANDAKIRLEIAQTMHRSGDYTKVFYSPVNNAVLGGSSAYEKNQLVHDNLCLKRPDTVKFKINQLFRFKRPSDDKEFLKVQCVIEVKDSVGKVRSFGADLGVYQRPVFGTFVTGYSPEDGSPLGTATTIDSWEDEYTIEFSEAQVKELAKHFDKNVSLLIKDVSGRKWTCESLDQFVGNHEGTINRLTPKKPRMDGSIA
jgi:hypothetical protein